MITFCLAFYENVCLGSLRATILHYILVFMLLNRGFPACMNLQGDFVTKTRQIEHFLERGSFE